MLGAACPDSECVRYRYRSCAALRASPVGVYIYTASSRYRLYPGTVSSTFCAPSPRLTTLTHRLTIGVTTKAGLTDCS